MHACISSPCERQSSSTIRWYLCRRRWTEFFPQVQRILPTDGVSTNCPVHLQLVDPFRISFAASRQSVYVHGSFIETAGDPSTATPIFGETGTPFHSYHYGGDGRHRFFFPQFAIIDQSCFRWNYISTLPSDFTCFPPHFTARKL